MRRSSPDVVIHTWYHYKLNGIVLENLSLLRLRAPWAIVLHNSSWHQHPSNQRALIPTPWQSWLSCSVKNSQKGSCKNVKSTITHDPSPANAWYCFCYARYWCRCFVVYCVCRCGCSWSSAVVLLLLWICFRTDVVLSLHMSLCYNCNYYGNH